MLAVRKISEAHSCVTKDENFVLFRLFSFLYKLRIRVTNKRFVFSTDRSKRRVSYMKLSSRFAGESPQQVGSLATSTRVLTFTLLDAAPGQF